MAAYRHLKRIIVVQALFEWEFYEEKVKPEEVLEYAFQETMNYARSKMKELPAQKIEEQHFEVDEWTKGLMMGVVEKIKVLREMLTKYAPEWPLSKIATVDRAILYVGIYELLFSVDVPEVVVINEGVEVAKAYGGNNSSKFVNGVLNSVYKNEKREGEEKKDVNVENDGKQAE